MIQAIQLLTRPARPGSVRGGLLSACHLASLEAHLLAAPAANWSDAAEKVRYLLRLFAATSAGHDPRPQTLIASVLDDFACLSAMAAEETYGADKGHTSREGRRKTHEDTRWL